MERVLASVALASALFSGLVAGETIYVTSYAGTVTQLELSRSDGNSTAASLQTVGISSDCGTNPDWLELDRDNGRFFCSNEPFNVENGSLASYSLDAASPTVIGNSTIPYHGPVHSWIYAPERIALAHYAGHAVTVYDIFDDTTFTQLQAFEFNQTYNGSTPRQNAAYPHSIIPDPTGQFLVSPDLGADQLRLFKVLGSEDDYLLELLEPVNTTYGSGPRHGAFVQVPESGKTFYYILGEIGTSITGYEVTYPEGDNGSTTIAFKQVYLDSVFQEGYGNSTGAPAELYAPEYNHLVLSVRSDNRSTYEGQGSDSLVSYEIDPETGYLTLLGLTPSGGSTPRGFSLNAEGTLLGVANQGTGNVLVYERDTETGMLADTPLAAWTTEDLNNGNSLNYVLWWN